ncbi:MAG: DUF1998 domain-containing protein [Acidobacteria bacterium]|nr:DUF1998 domain-containing protein [Acidobacteriota bacterium]
MSGQNVGSVRPTQLIYTYGVGSAVDLPQFSAMVMGLDDWPAGDMEEIHEDRLLRVVRNVLGGQVRQLKAAPLSDDAAGPLFRNSSGDGVPVAAFPRWLVCTHCRVLAPIRSGLFEFRADTNRPERSCFIHKNCSGRARPTAIPARFLVACEKGHIDDFPWSEYLHGGTSACPGPLALRDVGASGEAADVMLSCRACQRSKPMAPAFSEEGKAALPACRGRHPHLRVAPLEECDSPVQPITLGATNMWFSRTLSALSIPSSADPLEQLVEQDLTALFDDVESEREVKLARRGHTRYDRYTDAQIRVAIGKLRELESGAPLTPKDLKLPEWNLFSKPDPTKNSPNLSLRVGTPLAAYAPWIESVVLIERLREVQALVGFTRLEPGGDDSTATLAPLRRGPAEWVPAAEVRGEGLFLRLSEAKVAKWQAKAGPVEAQFFGAHRRWRAQRGLEPPLGFPGLRYVLLHSISHALIRQFSVECGYAAASLRERIYSSTADDEEPMAGILIYTAAPDSEGTLGGLVTLGETANLEQHLNQALEGLEICSSDPLCAETRPEQAFMSLHGAACHNCLFLPETSCERGNRYLDRTVLVPTMEHAEFAFFRP